MNEASLFGTLGGLLLPALAILKSAALIAVPVVGAGIAQAVGNSHKRELIREIAQGGVAAALLKWPNLTSDTLVQQIVEEILRQPDPPTSNRDALTRAVSSALAVQKQANNVATAATHPGA